MTSTAWPQRGGVVFAPTVGRQVWLSLAGAVHAAKMAARAGHTDDAQRLVAAVRRGWLLRKGLRAPEAVRGSMDTKGESVPARPRRDQTAGAGGWAA